MRKNTVFFVEWNTSGREFDMQFPLMYFFKNELNWHVEYKCAYNLPSITETVPDLVILSGTGGEARCLQVLNWCHQSNIPVFSSFEEGMFREKDLDEFLWGWNKSGNFKEQLRMLWSMSSYKMAVKKYPILKQKLCVSGATGMDKYTLLCNKYNDTRGFKKFVGYAGFDFHRWLNNPTDNSLENSVDPEFIKYLTNKLKIIKSILEYLIKSNDDVLFLIKSHPADQGQIPLEIDELENFQNVKVIRSKSEPIAKVVASSDIWLCGNSTTVIDGWLCKKPTIAFVGKNQEKTIPALNASILSQDKKQIDGYIKEFYKKKKISHFERLEKERERHISDLIGFSDGMNHIRYMSFLKPVIEAIDSQEKVAKRWKISLKERLLETLKHYIYCVSKGRQNVPFLSKWAHTYERFKRKDLQIFWDTYEADISKFYDNNREKIDYLYNNYRDIFESERKISGE